MRSRRESNVLFHGGQLFEVLARQEAEMNSEIDRLDEERLLASPIDALVDYFVQKYKVEMVTLDRAGITIGDHGDVDVPRDDFGRSYQASVHAVSFLVPFTGDSQLFNYQGSTLSSMYPRAEVGTAELTIVVMAEQTDAAVLRQKLEQELRLIDQWLGGVGPMVSGHNQKVASEAKRRIDARKARALDRRNLVANLGFAVKQRGQQAVAVPLTRRRIVPQLPAAPVEGFKPEPAISSEDYESILRAMHQMTLVMERSPSSFATADEEAIRTQFLVPLNGQFEGAATAETFNGSGKTDILIRVDGKNVFIAECKFWKGPDSLHKAIDQLRGT
jgi:hypothetical protein